LLLREKITVDSPIREEFMPWHVYILECKDGKLYTGITNNLERRIKAHNRGHGCRFTRCRTPVTLRYSEQTSSRPKALIRETGIKRLARKKKLELILSS
jgi:putative endonuclease